MLKVRPLAGVSIRSRWSSISRTSFETRLSIVSFLQLLLHRSSPVLRSTALGGHGQSVCISGVLPVTSTVCHVHIGTSGFTYVTPEQTRFQCHSLLLKLAAAGHAFARQARPGQERAGLGNTSNSKHFQRPEHNEDTCNGMNFLSSLRGSISDDQVTRTRLRLNNRKTALHNVLPSRCWVPREMVDS